MFTRAFRVTIQSSIIRSRWCNDNIFKGSVIQKLQHVNQSNSMNNCVSQNQWIRSMSSVVPLLSTNFNSYTTLFSPPITKSILTAQALNVINTPTRSITKFSRSRGKRRCCKTVLRRFYRLNWGIWIRTKAGRHKRLWTKRASRRRRLRQHVFCNASQSWLLDKMVTPYWRKPKYFVDDPYNPYHSREEFWLTRTKPRA